MITDSLMRKALAEFVGIFVFFFIGIGSVLSLSADPFIVAAAHGLALAVMISTLGVISGGHFNPAVTFSLFIARRIDSKTLGYYWVAQVAGALLAALAIKIVFPSSIVDAGQLGTPQFHTVSWLSGLILEAILTFFLVLAVFGTTLDPRRPSIGGFGVGLMLLCGGLVGGPYTNGVMNPARALGPAVLGWTWSGDLIAYWIGPLLGAGIGAVVYLLFFWPEQPADSDAAHDTALWWYAPLMGRLGGMRNAAMQGQPAQRRTARTHDTEQ